MPVNTDLIFFLILIDVVVVINLLLLISIHAEDHIIQYILQIQLNKTFSFTMILIKDIIFLIWQTLCPQLSLEYIGRYIIIRGEKKKKKKKRDIF